MDSGANEAIAIIGSACRFPGSASSSSKLWEVLRDPKDLCTPLPPSRFNAAGFYHSSSAYHGHSNVRDMRSYFLSEDSIESRFDAAFFGINPAEANVLDPQVRLLLETTYEALEAAGQTVEGLQGSDTGCYVGLMMGEYEVSMLRDPEAIGKYHITGTARSLYSNRLSYFFDWHGPSMTIDTACSSSLIAVHQAVQLLRSRQAGLAVAAGANMILDPITHVSESKLQMLSPDGRGRMWDAGANGYARGEGVATLVLKRLSDAIRDGDHIESIIRETGTNQDGKTRGITMPSPKAQAALIRETYRRAGLDPASPHDRPQYFEAHGTGTPAGDPVEAEAIHSAFFPGTQPQHDESPQLLVGSIKTVLGHSEGTAGIAAILKASLALQHGAVPPNLLLESLNPKIRPFIDRLRVPTSLTPWPKVEAGQPRRASVNSFGFGGSNAHAILEAFEDSASTPPSKDAPTVFTPFVFSAASEKSLKSYLGTFASWLDANSQDLDMRSLAHTLHSRKTRLQFGTAIAALDAAELVGKINEKLLSQSSTSDPPFSVRCRPDREQGPTILGVFTGQGAQWPAMGAELLAQSSTAVEIVSALEARLARLPEQDRPQWSLLEEMRRPAGSSRVAETELSQPVCTAVQIVLVDLLRASGIEFGAVVGHSSGEMAAAYAAGVITADDAICIAYYRGLHSHLAAGRDGQKGAMMAAGVTVDDASELVGSHVFQGRAVIAAYNSSTSLTLSGDEDAIEELKVILEDEQKFARRLVVEKAYHSHHMERCAGPYGDSLKALNIQPSHKLKCPWISSVSGDEIASYGLEKTSGEYWVENAVNPVLFMQAVQRACELLGDSEISLAIELGPHPALRGPATQTIRETTGQAVPYTGLLKRKSSDVASLADGLGYAWANLPKGRVDLQAFDAVVSGSSAPAPGFVDGLPPYAWDHDTKYWHQSRHARESLFRRRPHELLGHLTSDLGGRELAWRQMLSPAEIPWLNGHRLQDQAVLPAAAYVSLAIEAGRELLQLHPDLDVGEARLIHVRDIEIHQAMTFDDDDSKIEAVFSLGGISIEVETVSARFKYFGGPSDAARAGGARGGASTLRLLASGTVEIVRGQPSKEALPPRGPRADNMLPVKEDDFYQSLRLMGYEYSGPFRTLSGLQRKLGAVSGWLSHEVEDKDATGLLVHPGMLDVAFQAVILAKAAPYDGTLWSMHVPKTIKRVTVNPLTCAAHITARNKLPFDSFQSGILDQTFRGDVDVFASGESVGAPHAIIQVEDLDCVPFSRATAEDDREPLSVMSWDFASPDAEIASHDIGSSSDPQELKFAHFLERLAFFYLQRLQRLVPSDHPCRRDGMPLCQLFGFAKHIESRVMSGKLPFWEDAWFRDTPQTIEEASRPYTSEIDYRLLSRIGENLVDIAQGTTTAIEITRTDDILDQYYASSIIMGRHTTFLGRMVKQITHRHPHLDILEIGAGTGVATKEVLRTIGDSFSSYTFTDISSGFFPAAQEYFGHNHPSTFSRMLFRVLDVGASPKDQGFEPHSYDVVVVSMVLHATPVVRESLRHVRQLLRPGGYLVVHEVINNDVARCGTIFGAFPGWWLGNGAGGDGDGRDGRLPHGPALPLEAWDRLLHEEGFAGCDSSVPVVDPLLTPNTVFIAQATDARVGFLRKPLSVAASKLGLGSVMQEVVVVGGASAATSGLVRELEGLLKPYFGSVRHIATLEGIGARGVPVTQASTVLSLSDIDAPFCRNVTEKSLRSMKELLHNAGSVLWVTDGRRADNPFANMTVGLVRSVLLEVPTLSFQFLDFEDVKTLKTSVIAESLLRFKAGLAWLQKRNSPQGREPAMLMTVERELVVDNRGQVLIPRMCPAQDMNDRYNSGLRPIFGRKPLRDGRGASSTLVLKRDQDHGGYILEESEDEHHPGGLEVTHSSLSAFYIRGLGHAHINLVRDQDGSLQLLLSSKTASVLRPLPNLPLVPTGGPEDRLKDPDSRSRFLVLFALNLLATSMVAYISSGERLVVYEPEPAFATILKAAAEDRGVKMTVMTSSMSRQRCELLGWTLIHPQAPARNIRNALPTQASVFLVCRGGEKHADAASVATRIAAGLPSSCRTVSLSELCGQEARLRSIQDEEARELHGRLRAAASRAQGGLACPEYRTFGLDQVSEITATRNSTQVDMAELSTVVDWERSAEVPVRIRPVDDQTLFSGSKTYWLAGLSGSLGLSLCEWMISRGARHVLITSRTPKVSRSWLDKMSSLGAVVKVLSNDLTDLAQTQSLYQDISSIMPPIGGVAQGAMVLCDSSFSNMTLDDWQTACRGKVQGTIHLDQLLGDADLDFFICFSSVSAVAGNPGQSNYTAANLFMTSVAERRRRRGLAASVMHISPLLGVGYVSEKIDLTKTNFARTSGYSLHAERDFHQQFAEAVVAGRANDPSALPRPLEVAMGLHKVSRDPEKLPFWFENPTISHFISNDGDARQKDSKSVERAESVESLLASAESWDRVHQVLREALKPFLTTLFQIQGGADLTDAQFLEMPLDEIGLDSLLAVEIRTWWLKTAKVSLPVMKILSGITIGQLITAGVEGLSSEVVPNVKSGDAGDLNAAQTQVPAPVVRRAESSEGSDGHEQSTDTDHSEGAAIDSPVTPYSVVPAGKSTPSPLDSAQDGFSIPTPLDITGEDKAVAPIPKEPPVAVERWTELSPSQKMFWFILNFLEEKTGLNHTGMYRVTGPLRVSSFRSAFEQLGQRHESLRTCFRTFDGWHPKQGVMETTRVHLEHRHIADAREATPVLEELRAHRYDLEAGECLRAILLEQSPTDHYLVLGTHTLVLDGFSNYVLMQDLLRLYNDGPTDSSPATCQYPAFADAQLQAIEAGAFDADLQFWTKELTPPPAPMPPMTVSSCIAHRPAQTRYDNHVTHGRLDGATKLRVQEHCRRRKTRPFHFLLTAFRALLARFVEDVDEVAIGIGDANRTHEGALEGLGQYFNLLPLRFANDAARTTFEAALGDTKEKADRALSHSRVPFQVLLERLGVHRSPTHTPIFQSFFDYRQTMRERQDFGDCQLELLNFDGARSPYDISLEIIDDRDHEDYRVMLIVRADMYSEQDAELLLASYQKLVHAFASSPDIVFDEPAIFEPQEVERALAFGRGEAVPSQWNGESVAARIQTLATSHPTRLACKLPNGGKSMTYGEMLDKSRAVADTLKTSGCTAGSVVALYQEPTPEWLSSLLAIFSIGAVCVPFDASTLLQRLAVMADDSKASVVLTDNLIDSQNLLTLSAHGSRKIINVEQIPVAREQGDETVPPLAVPRAEDPAIIIYTSGSTGVPKGTVLQYGSLSNWAEFVAPFYLTDEGPGTVLQQTSIGFDIAYLQVLVALCHGGTLCLVPRDKRVDPSAITTIIADEGVNFTAGVPSELANWLHFGDRAALARSTSWRTVCMGGEAVSLTLLELQRLLGPQPPPRFFHIYGPTETCITATSAEVFYDGREGYAVEPLPVGTAFPNYTAYVLDDRLRALPPGVQGEVCFGGAGVAAGYLGNAPLTAERFPADPFAPASFRARGWANLHRTGDRGRWRRDGRGLQIEGRRGGDTQRKIRGFRVDLQEVEKVLLKEAGGVLSQAVVTVRRAEQPDGPEFLVAHAQFHPQHCPEDPREQQSFLNELSSRLPLPQYMRPAITFPLEELPVTISGKLDRRALAALPLPEVAIPSDHHVDGPDTVGNTDLTETEEWLKQTWQKIIPESVITSHQIGTETDFFHVGGTSILLLRLQSEIRQKLAGASSQVPLVQLFAHSKLGSMARLIDQTTGAAASPSAAAPAGIDWDAETDVSPQTRAALRTVVVADHEAAREPPRVVVLTGATGLLGRALVRRLVADPAIEKIHCVAVRSAKSRASFLPPELKNEKVVLHEGDLTQPRLGLSLAEARAVFAGADSIVHNGADTSHLQAYGSLRAANLQSTKEIMDLLLAAGGGKKLTPIHYISTASVLQYSGRDEFGEASAAGHPPPADDALDGYSASKWASEAYLGKVHEASKWPIWIHRPTAIVREDEEEAAGSGDGGEIIPALLKYSKLTGAVPRMPNIRGFINLVPLGAVVESVAREMMTSDTAPAGQQLRFVHERGDSDIPVSGLSSYVEAETGKQAVEQLPPGEFARRAARAGMDEVLVAFFESLGGMPPFTWPRLLRGDGGQ